MDHRTSSEQVETCFHEAGHAVVAIALGQRFDYITMRPRGADSVAHVMTRGAYRDRMLGRWESIGAVRAAGILAQDFHLEDWGYENSVHECQEVAHRRLTREDGRTDMRGLKDEAWYAWASSVEAPGNSATLIQPHWSPVDLAVVAWRRAVVTLAAHWEAVDTVAEELYYSTKRMPYRAVREIVDSSWVDDDMGSDFPDEYLKPWFLDHSRLKWMPPGRWFADVKRYAEMRHRHEAEVAARCADCGCSPRIS